AWLADHVVQTSTVLPGAAYIEMAVSSVLSTRNCDGEEIEALEIRRPLVIAAGAEPSVEIALSAEEGTFRLHANDTRGTTLPPVAVARALPLAGSQSERLAPVDAIRARMGKR